MTGLVLFLLMEGLWLGAIAVLADGLISGQARPEAALVVLAYPAALLLARPLQALRRRRVWWLAAHALASGLFAWLAVTLLQPGLSLPIARTDAIWLWLRTEQDAQRVAALSALALFGWTRGVILSGRRVDAEAVALGFQIGLLVLISVQGWAWAKGLALPGAVAANVGFVCAALLSLWRVRAAQRGGVFPAAFGLLLVLTLSGLVAVALHPAALAAVISFARAAWEILRNLIAALFAWLPTPEPTSFELPDPLALPAPVPPPEPDALFKPIAWLRTLFNIILGGVLALIVGTVLFLNLHGLLEWLRGRLNETPGIAHERSRRSVLDTLREIRRQLAEALRKRWGAFSRSLRPRPPAVVLERRRYRALLRALSARGWPRRPHETPAEYARRMHKGVWPGPGGDLVTLSRIYSASRYGGVRPPETRFARLWKKSRRSLRKVPFKP